MFSATMTEDVEKIMNDFFDHPEIIEAAPSGTPLDNIEQTGYRVPNFFTKVNLLEKLIADKSVYTKVLVFMDSKKLADQLFDLIEPKFSEEIGIIHSNKAQNNRFNTVQNFKDGTNRILIATDIIARGLDIAEVSHVFNFDMPEIPENYIHRIGRTGRADQTGRAITFITEKEIEYQTQVETLMNYQIPIAPLPEDLVISTELIDEEIVKVKMKNIVVKLTKKAESVGPAFHEKSAKNSKVNIRLSWEDKMHRKGKKIKGSGSKYKK
jgi:ATP-dependent RNA helicase RhlE